jgi:hypothetical protein
MPTSVCTDGFRHMALRVARGLFRLWLVLSVLWIGGVGYVTWQTMPSADGWAVNREVERLDTEMKRQNIEIARWEMYKRAHNSLLWHASVIALAPPAFALALGWALVWALRGFR